jgi:hypothetical protein
MAAQLRADLSSWAGRNDNKMKWSPRLALLVVPLTVAGLVLPVTAAFAWSDTVAITAQPTTTQVSTPMTPAVVVAVEQSNGSVDTSYNGPVTLTYADNPVGALEPSGNTVSAVSGVATFSALTFSAVGFGFELEATISDGTSSPASAPFDVVTQLVDCSPGQTCKSETVSSAGTAGSVAVAAGKTSDVLTATGGGFPLLSCSTNGGVVSFAVAGRSKVITLTLDKPPAGSGPFSVCWGSPTPFTTSNNEAAGFNPANDEYEGVLPYCWSGGPSPCIKKQVQKICDGPVVTTIDAPPGDPHISY